MGYVLWPAILKISLNRSKHNVVMLVLLAVAR